MRSMAFRSTSKFLPGSRLVFGSLLFITAKFGDLSLQEPESREVVGSGTDRISPTPAQVGLISEARLGHGLSVSREAELDPSGDKANNRGFSYPATADLIYQSSSESDSNSGREVYMVG
jgi:hypothetical protein